MSDLKPVIEVAFRLHEEGQLSHEALVRVLEQCVNIVSIENGYADELGLPFPPCEDVRDGRCACAAAINTAKHEAR